MTQAVPEGFFLATDLRRRNTFIFRRSQRGARIIASVMPAEARVLDCPVDGRAVPLEIRRAAAEALGPWRRR